MNYRYQHIVWNAGVTTSPGLEKRVDTAHNILFTRELETFPSSGLNPGKKKNQIYPKFGAVDAGFSLVNPQALVWDGS